jgi:hypothetical protein
VPRQHTIFPCSGLDPQQRMHTALCRVLTGIMWLTALTWV